MKRLFILIALFSFMNSQSQSVSEEWGLDIFFSGYQGEIVTDYNPSVLLKEMRPGLGLLYRWNIRNKLSIGIEGKYVQLFAADANHTGDARDVEFSTTILEGDLAVFYRFLELGSGWGKKHFTPYVGAGAGLMFITPEVTYTGAPPPGLNTEEHASTNMFYELGATYQTNGYMRIGLYWRHHKTFTDYLDGMGVTNSDSDWYYSIGITITSMFYREKESCFY